MSRTALIDGDVIRYQIGYATQRNTFKVLGRTFLTLVEAAAYADEEGIPQDMVETKLQADFIQAVFHTVDKFILNILQASKSDSHTIFLTGKGNYRETLATIRPYKGQRNNEKPIHYPAITKYLIERCGAIVIDGAEADDAMAWSQWGAEKQYRKATLQREGEPVYVVDNETCICTIDKDLKGVPGWHYDWNKDILQNVTLQEADHFFYTQLLTGDSVDNIEGCPQIGAKKAQQILEGARTTLELYRRCQESYVQAHRKIAEKFKTHCMNDEKAIFEGAMRDLTENAHLLWMQREEGVLWKPPA